MLKPMPRKSNNNTLIWVIVAVLIIAGIFTLIFAFRGGSDGTDEVTLAYTSAAETLAAQQLTLQAASTPTPTIAPVTSTVAFTPTLLSTPTVLVLQTLASPTNSAPITAVGCNDSAFVTDVSIPDNTAMAPGQTFRKTWKLQNTGTCPWTTSFKVSFLNGVNMNGVAEPITVEVAPGQAAEVSVNMTAPNTPGDALSYWILTNAEGQQFGTNFYVLVKVGGTGPTATPTATATNTPIP